MSRPPIFASSSSASGITVETSGARVVPVSRRADGSLRKELKIRPGFTPEEDVNRYRSQRAQQEDARSTKKVGIPGAAPVAVQIALTGLSKSQKKREKNKEKNKVEEIEILEEPEAIIADVRESWESDEEVIVVEKKVVVIEPIIVVDDAKRLKSLIKKLRQAELLREKADAGGEILEEQKQKIDGIAELEGEIAKLSL